MVPLVSGTRQAPSAPGSLSHSVKSSSQIEVTCDASSGRGDEVDNYKIEWFTAQGTDRFQTRKKRQQTDYSGKSRHKTGRRRQ